MNPYSEGASLSKPSASVPKAKRAVFAFCLASIDFEILHDPDLRCCRVVWVDHHEVGSKGRSQLRHESWVRHYDHMLAKSDAAAEFLAARPTQARPDYSQDNFRFIQLLSRIRIEKSCQPLASVRRRHIDGEPLLRLPEPEDERP
jgi:hypothetical protein